MYCERDLFLSDPEGKADFAIVFGSLNDKELEHRVRHGCYLYFRGVTSRLVLTGDSRHKHRSGESEAVRMSELAVSLGVPREQLYLEDCSNNTIENCQRCFELVHAAEELEPKFVSLVTSSWHSFRTLMLAERVFPNWIEFLCHPTQEGCNKENWLDSYEGQRIVENEMKLIGQLRSHGVQVPRRIWTRGRNARMQRYDWE